MSPPFLLLGQKKGRLGLSNLCRSTALSTYLLVVSSYVSVVACTVSVDDGTGTGSRLLARSYEIRVAWWAWLSSP